MKRSSLQRKTPLKRSIKPLRASKPLKRVSTKQSRINAAYSKAGPKFLQAHDVCEFPGCNHPSEQIHHRSKRGIHTLDESTWSALCAEHHAFVESHKNWARENGLMD